MYIYICLFGFGLTKPLRKQKTPRLSLMIAPRKAFFSNISLFFGFRFHTLPISFFAPSLACALPFYRLYMLDKVTKPNHHG